MYLLTNNWSTEIKKKITNLGIYYIEIVTLDSY